VHGAAHLGQWLVDDTGRLGLIDFDRYALGEPEFDLATFIVELRAESSLRMRAAEIEESVLEGFRAVAGEPDRRRLQVYVLHKRLTRVARLATALRPDAGQRATRELQKLQEPLAALTG
jgi:aminoglycoside phosphotransferase (APT) family kinase protein